MGGCESFPAALQRALRMQTMARACPCTEALGLSLFEKLASKPWLAETTLTRASGVIVTNRTCHVRTPSFRVMSCLETNILCAIHGTLASCRNKKVFVCFRIRTQVQRPAATILVHRRSGMGRMGQNPPRQGQHSFPVAPSRPVLFVIESRCDHYPILSLFSDFTCVSEHERYANPVSPGLRALLSCGETSGARCHPLSAFHRHRGLLLLPAA